MLVFLKWSQWSWKTTPFLPCQKQLCSQQLVSLHISLHANELCSPRPSLLWKSKRDSQIIIKNIKCETYFFWRCSWIMNNGYWSILEFWLKRILNEFSESEVTCGQVWWPILGICALHLTHSSAHTHTHTINTHPEQWADILLWHPGSSWWFGGLLKGLTSVMVLKVEESAGIHSKIKMAW